MKLYRIIIKEPLSSGKKVVQYFDTFKEAYDYQQQIVSNPFLPPIVGWLTVSIREVELV